MLRENPRGFSLDAAGHVLPGSPATDNGDRNHAPRNPRALVIAYSAFVLVAIGRVGDLIPGLGSLPLAKLAMGIAIAVLFSNWRQLPKLASIVRPWLRSALLLAVLAILTVPISIWPGASFAFLYTQLPVLAATVTVASKLSNNWLQLRNVTRMLVVSAFVLALSALSGFRGGRASSATNAYDTNDLAYLLVTVLPLAFAFALTAKTRMARLVNGMVLGLLLVALLLTSSRGGFFGLLTVLTFLVFLPIKRPQERPHGQKVRKGVVSSLIAVLCLGAVLWPNLPFETRNRLATVLTLQSDYNLDARNNHSRSSIWQRNLTAVLHRPIGYGVDSFPMVDMSTGGQFMAPHNSYLETLVELGFLGFILFLRVYLLAWRMLGRVRSALLSTAASGEKDEVLVFARMLQASILGNAVAGFFLSMAYSIVLWTLLGIVIACTSLVTASWASHEETPAGAPGPVGDTTSA
jgi:putative inorganic carbon (HCO3(-)) transporter